MAAAIAAAVAAAATVAATTASAVSQAKAGKKSSTTTQGGTPQQTAIQQVVSRALLDRYNQGPQSLGDWRKSGTRPYPQMLMTPFEAQALGYQTSRQGAWRLPGGERIIPQNFTMDMLHQMQQDVTPAGLQRIMNMPANQRPPWAGEFGGQGDLWHIQGDPGEVLNNIGPGHGQEIMERLRKGESMESISKDLGNEGSSIFGGMFPGGGGLDFMMDLGRRGAGVMHDAARGGFDFMRDAARSGAGFMNNAANQGFDFLQMFQPGGGGRGGNNSSNPFGAPGMTPQVADQALRFMIDQATRGGL